MPKQSADKPVGPAFLHLGIVPPLQVALSIARTGVREPGKLTDKQVQDLSRALLVHYAQMGIC